MTRATGVGSFPAGDALGWARIAVASFPALPFLVEVPALDADDAMLRRPFAGSLEAPKRGAPVRLGVELEVALAAVPRLGQGIKLLGAALAERRAPPPPAVKAQLVGPATLARGVLDKHGRPLAATVEGRQVARARVEKVAKAIVDGLRGLGAKQLVFFLDEPAPDDDPASLAAAVAAVRAMGATVGVHCCGPDWPRVIAAKPDFVGVDVTRYGTAVEKKPRELVAFVTGGGSLALGLVPTTTFDARFSPDSAADVAARIARALAPSAPRELLARSIITPACGTALLDPEKARAIHAAAAKVAEKIRSAK